MEFLLHRPLRARSVTSDCCYRHCHHCHRCRRRRHGYHCFLNRLGPLVLRGRPGRIRHRCLNRGRHQYRDSQSPMLGSSQGQRLRSLRSAHSSRARQLPGPGQRVGASLYLLPPMALLDGDKATVHRDLGAMRCAPQRPVAERAKAPGHLRLSHLVARSVHNQRTCQMGRQSFADPPSP